MPLFSAIMRTWNRAEYIAEAIESVRKQTISDWELIVVSDGCTDSTPELMEYYTKLDKRIKYFQKEHTGIADTGNYGIARSTGKYIVQTDSDDIQLPNKLEIAAEGLVDADYTYSGYYHANTKGEIWEYCRPKPLTPSTLTSAASGESIAYHRYVWEKIPYRTELTVNDDIGFLVDLYKSTFTYKIVDRPSFKYRMLSDGTSYAKKKEVDVLTSAIKGELNA